MRMMTIVMILGAVIITVGVVRGVTYALHHMIAFDQTSSSQLLPDR